MQPQSAPCPIPARQAAAHPTRGCIPTRHPCLPGQQHVGRLHVEMNDALCVEVCKPGTGTQGSGNAHGQQAMAWRHAAQAQGAHASCLPITPSSALQVRPRATSRAICGKQGGMSQVARGAGTGWPCLKPAGHLQRVNMHACQLGWPSPSSPSCRGGTRSPAPPSSCGSGCRRHNLRARGGQRRVGGHGRRAGGWFQVSLFVSSG